MNRKQRILHSQGASNITYSTIAFNFDVYRLSSPVSSTGYDLTQSWSLDYREWIPHSLSVETGFRISIVNGIPNSLSCIPVSKAQDLDSTSIYLPDSRSGFPLTRPQSSPLWRESRPEGYESGIPAQGVTWTSKGHWRLRLVRFSF